MPASYTVNAWLRSAAGLLTIELRTDDQAAFNACIVDAIRAARIPAELTGLVEIPLTFDFTSK